MCVVISKSIAHSIEQLLLTSTDRYMLIIVTYMYFQVRVAATIAKSSCHCMEVRISVGGKLLVWLPWVEPWKLAPQPFSEASV